jgi:uncharacterized protein YjbI with pentapeptide repeats
MQQRGPSGAFMTEIMSLSYQNCTGDRYLHIKNEQLSLQVVQNQVLAGSRVESSRYRKVVFSQCNFYGCEFQGVIFENCIFEDCNFEFSHFRHCQFVNCNFRNCSWKASSTSFAQFRDCELELAMGAMVEGKENQVIHYRAALSQTDIFECLLAS